MGKHVRPDITAEQAKDLLGVNSIEQAMDLALDSLLVAAAQVAYQAATGDEVSARRGAKEIAEAIRIMPTEMKDAIISASVVRLVKAGPTKTLVNSMDTLNGVSDRLSPFRRS